MPTTGSCHCGRISYSLAEDPPTRAMACNCSICRRKGYLHHFTTPARFTLKSSRDDIQVYSFKTHAVRHQFCKTCGCAPFAEGLGSYGEPIIEINLRCVDGLDVGGLEIISYDGASR
ncbi:GFA family protein [Allosphingosinicella deserti]|uniref:Aldehyde-activating protein n=1 Tax=Allosphingosinicella deserti TaxID=2116704 RepID=A0A2P7QUA5_9SPHN|nr:GFA family protein [Sphingomonas deserti]PSJ41552.1 aldehyde-activating protein [Sphingomonas deserti]